MSETTSPLGLEIVRRGYDVAQTNERVTKLTAERDNAHSRVSALEKRIEELHLENQSVQAQLSDSEPSYAGLGARVEKILRLAEEEAKDLREEARRAADQHRELAEQAAGQVRADAENYGKEVRAKAEAEGVRTNERAKEEANQTRAEAAKDAAAKRAEAEAHYEEIKIGRAHV